MTSEERALNSNIHGDEVVRTKELPCRRYHLNRKVHVYHAERSLPEARLPAATCHLRTRHSPPLPPPTCPSLETQHADDQIKLTSSMTPDWFASSSLLLFLDAMDAARASDILCTSESICGTTVLSTVDSPSRVSPAASSDREAGLAIGRHRVGTRENRRVATRSRPKLPKRCCRSETPTGMLPSKPHPRSWLATGEYNERTQRTPPPPLPPRSSSRGSTPSRETPPKRW